VACERVAWLGTTSPPPSTRLALPRSASSSISARTGQGCGLKTTTGVVPGSSGIAIRPEIACAALYSARVAMAAASPNWSRASS